MPTQSEITELARQAVAAYAAGAWAEAEKLCRSVLSAQADCVSALDVLGAITAQTRRPKEAAELLGRVVAAQPGSAAAHNNLGNALRAMRQFAAAVASYDRAIAIKPDFSAAHNNRGNALHELEQYDAAIESYDRAIAFRPDYAQANYGRGNALKELRQLDAAIAGYDRAIAVRPDYAEAYNNRGAALRELNQPENAVASYDQAIALKPDFAVACCNRGNALQDLGQLDAAIASYDRAIAIKPDYAEAHIFRGDALWALKQPQAAIASYDCAVAANPDAAVAYYSRGIALQELRQLDASIANFKRAIALKPNFAPAHAKLGSALIAQGRHPEAESIYRKALEYAPDSAAAKNGYAECISAMKFHDFNDVIYSTAAAALAEAWIRPLNLSAVACNLLALRLKKKGLFKPNQEPDRQTPRDPEPVDLDALATLDNDPILNTLLGATPIVDAELEDYFTLARRGFLDKATNAAGAPEPSPQFLKVFCSLAKQCYINEYVFSVSETEIQSANRLKQLLQSSLENDEAPSALLVIAVACYLPLYSLARPEKLLVSNWTDEIRSLIAMQIEEPLDELRLRSDIPRLTQIEDGVSLAVQSQYEENPYPRWIRIPQSVPPQPLDVYLRNWFPFVDFVQPENIQHPDILIAGCGTGQHPIDTARSIQGAKILAIDLSMASLGYAKRKTRELQIGSIKYAQADILKLDTLGRTFDVIESSGVLHHLANPFDGWRMLLSLLRPKGFMKLGFYSEIARQYVVKARELISAKGYGSTPDEIRECRQYLRQIESAENLTLTRQGDFFSTSNCRDLLFHVQEHRMTIDLIADFLKEQDLSFLGFQFESSVAQSYARRFPDDRASTNLEHWKIFEHENPDVFGRMYQFWIQKQ